MENTGPISVSYSEEPAGHKNRLSEVLAEMNQKRLDRAREIMAQNPDLTPYELDRLLENIIQE